MSAEVAEALSKSSAGYSKLAARYGVSNAGWDNLDVSQFAEFHTLKWWDKQWTYESPPTRNVNAKEGPSLPKLQDKSKAISGQTIVMFFATGQGSNTASAALLGFKGIFPYITWLDTQGKLTNLLPLLCRHTTVNVPQPHRPCPPKWHNMEIIISGHSA